MALPRVQKGMNDERARFRAEAPCGPQFYRLEVRSGSDRPFIRAILLKDTENVPAQPEPNPHFLSLRLTNLGPPVTGPCVFRFGEIRSPLVKAFSRDQPQCLKIPRWV